jgi:uncharacterized membrane protein
MRPLTLLGILLMAAGAFLLFRGASYSSRENLVEIGGVEVTAERERPVPAWVGAVVAVVGLGLVVAGSRPRG